MKDPNIENCEGWQILAIALKKIALKKGITQTELEKKTGIQQANISRFFNGKLNSLKSFQLLSEALGVKLILDH